MYKQKNLITVVVSILIPAIISLAIYFVLVKKPSVTQEAEVLISEQNIPIKINYSGEWKEASLPSYRQSINIMLPATWQFECCADTDSFSSLSIFPSLSNSLEVVPSIVVTEFVLMSCPESYPNCSSDEARRLSPVQFMNSKIKELDTDTQLIKRGSIRLPNFPTDISVYNGISYTENQPFELYLIQSPNGVVKIEFRQSDKFEPSFKAEFLSKLAPN